VRNFFLWIFREALIIAKTMKALAKQQLGAAQTFFADKETAGVHAGNICIDFMRFL